MRIRTGVLVLLLALSACGEPASTANSADGRLRVLSSVAPLTSIVASVAGERAEVAGLVPEGTNSHTFEPPPSAASLIARADILFLNGLQLEDPTRELAEVSLGQEARLVLLGDRTLAEDEYLYDFSFPIEGGKPNPHTWTNPPMAIEYAEEIERVLAEVEPAGAAEFRENRERFAAKAKELDAAMRSASATVPVRKLLTYHDAYAYFAETYGWEVIGAIQVSDFEEPTPSEVARLSDQVKRHRVPAIFGSEVFPSPILEQIGREAGVQYVDTLRDDDLPGEPGDPEHSWLGLMRFNFITMVSALGGDASALEAVELPQATDDAEYPQ